MPYIGDIMKIKKIILVLCAFFSGAFVFSKAPYRAEVQESFKLNKYNRKLGYQITEGGNKIVFVFDAASYNIAKPTKVFVEGSFNGWAKKNPGWELSPFKKDKSVWTLECEKIDVMIPGNSGFPEFKFVITEDKSYIETVCGQELHRTRSQTTEPKAISRIPGFQMATNNLILFPEDNPLEIVENTKIADKQKKLKEFDLENPEDQKTLANFRLVPGTSNLFRGYHPYKKSKTFDTEDERIKMVNKLLRDNKIQSVITLSGNEQIDAKKEQISVYAQTIKENKNWLFVDTNYNTVYYRSNGEEFGNLIAKIVDFINSHPGPYYVHCRLGTDRTGAVSAVLAALSGASWEEIKKDYQKSNDAGIKEFRDYRLLQYSFEQMLFKPIDKVENLQQELSNYFIENNYLTSLDIKTLQERLKVASE